MKPSINENNLLPTLSRIGKIVGSHLDLTDMLHRIASEAQSALDIDLVSILLKENEEEVSFIAVSDARFDILSGKRFRVGTGVAGKVISSKQPALVNQKGDQDQIYRMIGELTGYYASSMFIVPVMWGEVSIGALIAAHSILNAFTKEDYYLLENVAAWTAIAISEAQQEKINRHRLRESEAFIEIGRALLGTLDVQEELQTIVDSAKKLIPNVDRAVIHLYNEQKKVLEISAISGLGDLKGNYFTLQPGEGVAGKVLAEGKTIYIPDTGLDPSYLPLGSQVLSGSLLVAPIQSGVNLLGTISVRSEKSRVFSPEHERLLTILGVQAALAIHNTRLFEAEQKFRKLAETLLHQEKSTRAHMVQSEKLAALGRIVASVAHELNNPLQAIQNAIYLVQQEDCLSPQIRKDLTVVLGETNRMAELIARLRETYRPSDDDEFRPGSLNGLVEEVLRLLATHLRHRNIQASFLPDPALPPIMMNSDQIRQIIINLSMNAAEAMGNGGSLLISTHYQRDREEVVLAVEDTGCGIPDEVLPNIFEPFFTTKEGGTGLGLAITYDIVQRHKGRIEVESRAGEGSTFRIRLPVRLTLNQTSMYTSILKLPPKRSK
jgi:signal transduction histidine kinase